MSLSRPALATLAIVITAGVCGLHLGLARWAFDDAFIHFRIADHWVRFGAPYFNPGDAVMAGSSPLWTLLLSVPALAGALTPAAVAVINAILTVTGAAGWTALLRRCLPERSAGVLPLAGFFVAYVALVHYASAGLMETTLALWLLGLGLLDARAERPRAFLWLALAPCARLELAVFLPLLLAARSPRRPSRVRAALSWACAGAIVPVAYQLYYFGTLVPHTMRAKKVVYSLDLAETAAILADHAQPALTPLPAPLARAVFLIGLGALAGWCLAWIRSGTGDRGSVPAVILAGGLVIPAVYLASRGLVFPWYVPLFTVPLAWSAWLGATARPRPWVTALLLLTFMAPAFWALGGSVAAVLGRPDLYRYFASNARTRKYIEIGRRLGSRYPQATLMSSEIGGLGWGFAGRVEDGVGLITPGALRHHPMTVPEQRSAGYIGAIPAAYVREQRPALIVSLDIFIEDLLRDPVLREYRGLTEPIYVDEDRPFAPAGGLWGSTRLHVLIRRDLGTRP